MHKEFTPALLPLVALLPFSVTAANLPVDENDITTTETVHVTASAELAKDANETTISHKDVQREMIRDARDLARYDPDLGITDSGRHQRGFSLRGVEGNRVAITVDGISLPEYEDNSLYARYGNFNNSRQSIDTEIVRNISINRGSDSFKTGSGALGGDVSYETMNASDIVAEGDTFGALGRVGFAGKNNEWVQTVGAAWETDDISAILMYSHRYGHELDSTGEGPYWTKKESQQVDPSTHKNNTYLAKFRYKFNPEHSVGLSLNGQVNENYVYENSYQLSNLWREAEDTHDRHSGAIDYTWAPYNDWINTVKVTADAMYVKTGTINYKLADNYDWVDLLEQGKLEGWWTDPIPERTKTLQEEFDRSFETKYGQLAFDLSSASINFYGEHNFDVRLMTSRKDFENVNHDRYLGEGYDHTYHQTIQHPVRTTQFVVAVNDNIFWYPDMIENVSTTVGAHLGVRYDWSQIKPREAKYPLVNGAAGTPKKTSFDNFAFNFGLDLELAESVKVGYVLTTAFRNPTASEMYFTYRNPYGTWLANPDLEPEKSLNQTVFLTAAGPIGNFEFNAYQIDYKDFLMEKEGWKVVPPDPYWRPSYALQMVNVEDAKIRGVEAQGRLNFDYFNSGLKGWSLMGLVGWSEGDTSEGLSMMAIQPLKAVAGLDYESPSGNWGVFSRLTYLGEKKAKDAIVQDVDDEVPGPTKTYDYLNDDATVFDLFGWWNPRKNVTIRAGVYNLFDEKYQTWDALRGIQKHTTTNGVDPDGKGLQRFYAPGRNFSVAMEIRF